MAGYELLGIGSGVYYCGIHGELLNWVRSLPETPLLTSANSGGGAPYLFLGDSISAFTASELLLSVRIYEPFRGLIR